MRLIHFDHASHFYEQVKSYLLEHEAENNLLLGVSDALIRSPESFTSPPYLVVAQADEILAVALKVASRKLILSQAVDCQVVEALAQDLHSRQEQVPGVIGAAVAAKLFAEAWQMLTGQSYQKDMAQRIYQLETVQPIAKANGCFRQAGMGDRDLLVRWCKAFIEEANGKATEQQETERLVDRRLSEGTLYLWQDHVPVSMAGSSGPTPNGIRINLVYTPPEYRKQGYASSCVAALSQTLLDAGRKYCFLFTDLANPTSNHIYQIIGYHPVCDVSDYSFIS